MELPNVAQLTSDAGHSIKPGNLLSLDVDKYGTPSLIFICSCEYFYMYI